MAKTLDEARKKLDDEYGQVRRHLQKVHDALDKVERDPRTTSTGCSPTSRRR
jgi:hypothetical protein